MVKTQGLSKYYTFGSGNQVVALNDVNLTVASGEFVSIMGPSGSGKSTLLNIVGCLDKPTTGDVYIDDVKIDYGNAGSLVQLHRQTMGFVFQGFNLISTMNAIENVWYPMYFNKVPKPERIKRAEELLESVGLRDRALHLPSELSGGEQQRVSIARALANHPRLILADEPTGNIDSRTGKMIIDLMKKLNKEQGITFIVTTHDNVMANNADRVITITDGEIVD
ncbi:MAG: ABC transporter ATP-binding protein [ANME-2 cluster archaeon]|nr:ABC transporter ATP-binding protein [ANME-2 cluster archaeon]MBC2702353.1 ABC transporter ATP-binding protein [ANME-2 cluster archaeon]MBC2708633.1 ABC transporter ATP-binding protein [ANME-2 cluster archaeon]MBC2747491.1 ABC transporter ATP-binding protein [ANME-2 cluster archaeon]MBC2763179.1 ABC transporter ATP-binding protein [ANME-2 cluster archaeon]